MSDKENKLIKEIVQNLNEFESRFTTSQIVECISHQQQLIESQTKKLEIAVKVLEEIRIMEFASIGHSTWVTELIDQGLESIQSLSGE